VKMVPPAAIHSRPSVSKECRPDGSSPCASCSSRSVCLMPDGSSFPTWSRITSSVVPMHYPCCPKCRYLGLQRPHFTHPRGPSSFQTLPTDVFSLSPQTYRGAAYLLCIGCHNPDLDRHSLLVWSTTHHCYPVDPGSCS
jgi:hypothetical protein